MNLQLSHGSERSPKSPFFYLNFFKSKNSYIKFRLNLDYGKVVPEVKEFAKLAQKAGNNRAIGNQWPQQPGLKIPLNRAPLNDKHLAFESLQITQKWKSWAPIKVNLVHIYRNQG